MDNHEIRLRHVDGGDLTLSLLKHLINGGHGTSIKTRSTRFDLYSSLALKISQSLLLHQSLAFEKCRAAEETVVAELAASAATAVEGNLLLTCLSFRENFHHVCLLLAVVEI